MSPHTFSIRKSTTPLLAGLAFFSWSAIASADFKMLQNTSVGRVTAGARVECNAPGGFTHWDIRDISWKHNTSNQGAGKETALRYAMKSWTNVANATHQLNYDGTTSAGFATDGINTVVWGNTGTLPDCQGCLAITALVLQSGQKIIESDVIFTNGYTWTTNGSQYDTESVAAHEFGHTLGIHHPNTVSGPQTMSTPYFGTAMRSLHSDDIAALQCAENRYPAVCSGSPPPRPLEMNIFNHFCFGYNTVSWSASTCPVTRYELWGSDASSFSNPYLLYSGSGTQHKIQVTASQVEMWVAVRACNNTLCGLFRGPTRVTTYPGCCITWPC